MKRSRSASSTPSTRTPARSSGRTRASRASAIRTPASSSIASASTPRRSSSATGSTSARPITSAASGSGCARSTARPARLVWKTYIGQGQAELNMFGNPVKEVVPGYVGESNGLLVYSTNIGVVAAVDAITGVPALGQGLRAGAGARRATASAPCTRPPGWTVTPSALLRAPRDHRAERRLRRLRVQSRHRRLSADPRRPAQPR